MDGSSTAQRFVEGVSERSGVDAESTQRVLEALGLRRLVEKLTALDSVLNAASDAQLGPIADSARTLAKAVAPSELRLENLKLEYRLNDVPHGDGFAAALAE